MAGTTGSVRELIHRRFLKRLLGKGRPPISCKSKHLMSGLWEMTLLSYNTKGLPKTYPPGGFHNLALKWLDKPLIPPPCLTLASPQVHKLPGFLFFHQFCAATAPSGPSIRSSLQEKMQTLFSDDRSTEKRQGKTNYD